MTKIVISLERGPDDQPVGVLRKQSGETVRFIGWLALVRVLEDELRAAHGPAGGGAALDPSSAD
jgi:hypothetical protein